MLHRRRCGRCQKRQAACGHRAGFGVGNDCRGAPRTVGMAILSTAAPCVRGACTVPNDGRVLPYDAPTPTLTVTPHPN